MTEKIDNTMTNVVGVRFKRAGRIYYFNPGDIKLEVNDYAVVQTTRGLELGQVVISPQQILVSELTGPLASVVRKAEPEDIEHANTLDEKENAALVECGRLVAEMNLPMKLLSAEYNLDGSRLTLFFSAPERIDFRELVRELANRLKVRVELRQVGPRDKAKLVGGFGRCGRPLCCGGFLSEFSPVSIRMAKDQDLPLNPMKISGVCGRLLCCLAYESEQYRSMKAELPKKGQRVNTPMGIAVVIEGNPLKETVYVELESQAMVELPLEKINVEEEGKTDSEDR